MSDARGQPVAGKPHERQGVAAQIKADARQRQMLLPSFVGHLVSREEEDGQPWNLETHAPGPMLFADERG